MVASLKAEHCRTLRAWARKRVADKKQEAEPKRKRRKLNRTSAREWLLSTHNFLRQMTGVGLDFFHVTDDMLRQPSLSWPSLGVCMDEGSDGVCAMHFLQRKAMTNIDVHYDDSHAMKNDLNAALQSCGLWTHVLLMLAARRCFHGPWAEDRYFHTVQDSVEALLHELRPGECPLLQLLAPRILNDWGRADMVGDPDVEATVLKRVASSKVLRSKGSKPSLARYLDIIKASEEDDEHWHSKLYGILHALFFTGVLSEHSSGVAFSGKMKAALKKVDGDGQQQGGSSIKASDQQTQAIKTMGVNQLHFAGMMYADADNQRRERIIVCVAEPHKSWHTQANRANRSVAESFHWLLDQCDSGFVRSLHTAIDHGMGKGVDFARLGFVVSRPPTTTEEGHMEMDDEWASLQGNLVLRLVGFRVRRCLHFCMRWPTRACLLAHRLERKALAARNELKQAWEDYQTILQAGGDIAAAFRSCSMFEILPVKQYVHAFLASEWSLTPEIKSFAANQYHRILGTQCVEEMVHYAKAAANSAPSRRISDLRAWAAPIKAEIMTKIHRYDEVAYDSVALPRGIELDRKTFYLGAQSDGCWKPLLDVAGVEEHQSPPIWSHPIRACREVGASESLWLATNLFRGAPDKMWAALRSRICRPWARTCCLGTCASRVRSIGLGSLAW